MGPAECSKYVGRVGALAIALGIGVAIAGAPAIAWADDSTSSSGSGTTSTSAASSSSSPDNQSKPRSPGPQSPSVRRTSTTASKSSADDESKSLTSLSGSSKTPSETDAVDGTDEDAPGPKTRRDSDADDDSLESSSSDGDPDDGLDDGNQDDDSAVTDTSGEDLDVTAGAPGAPTAPDTTPTGDSGDGDSTNTNVSDQNQDTDAEAPDAPNGTGVTPIPDSVPAAAAADRSRSSHSVADRTSPTTLSYVDAAPSAGADTGSDLERSLIESADPVPADTSPEPDAGAPQPQASRGTESIERPAPTHESIDATIELVDTVSRNESAPSSPASPESPLPWALLAWSRRQLGSRLEDPQPAGTAAQASGLPTAEGLVAQAAPAAGPATTSVFIGDSPRVSETDGTVLVPIVRTGDLTGVTTVEYGITPDTATAGVDYVGENGTITMDVGVDRVFVTAQIIDDDLAEPTETFVVSIINVEGASLLFPRTARVDILDDEDPVVDPTLPPLTSDYVVTEEVVVNYLNVPLAIEFAPHEPSLAYVAEKGGVIKVVDVETGTQSTFVDISSKVNNVADRGLLDVVLHPDFGQPVQPGEPEHNFVYAFYVVDPPETADNAPGSNAGPDGGGNRFAYLVRFTADAATNYTTAIPDSEVIMLGGVAVPGEDELQPRTLEDISGAGAVDSTSDLTLPESGFDPQTGEYEENYIKVDSLSHAGGSLAFGPDGALYVSIGDGTSFDATDPRSVSVQKLDSLSGKILRIDPITGLGLSDNPFVGPDDDLSTNRAKVFQLGLRNPFSIGFADDGRLLISNTGWFSWEEIESGAAGANFGWPYFEGGDNGVLLPASGYADLPADLARDFPSAADFFAAVASGEITITPAYRAFAHDENEPGYQIQAIVGVPSAAYSGSQYPAEFQNDLFFADIADGEVFVVDATDRDMVKFLYSTEALPVAFSQGSDGYVYVANLTGTITRLLIEPKPAPSPLTFNPHGSASVTDDVYTLTDGDQQTGTAISNQRIDVNDDFTITFEINLGTNDNGADGTAIVFHNDPLGTEAIGTIGGGLAMAGIENGLAIEFDTYDNNNDGTPSPDIPADHTNFRSTDDTFATTPYALPNIEDGAWHTVTVTWNATTQTLSYTFDDQPTGTPLTSDITTAFFGGSNLVYFGFTAATGGLSNTQQIRNITTTATLENQPPTNTPPTAVPDTASTTTDTPVVIAVLDNDSDPDSDTLFVSAVSNITNGTATINGDNTITYTPDTGFTGTGGFTYTVSDGTDQSTASVTVTVTTPPTEFTFNPHGSASVTDDVYTLTDGDQQTGTAISNQRIDVNDDFTITFEINLGTNDNGADGTAIVFHNDPLGTEAIGTIGGGLAMAGIENGLAIEFDTYDNNNDGTPSPDIPADHTNFRSTDDTFATTPYALPNIEDGAWHTVTVTWNATTQTLSYTFDDQPTGTPLTSDITTAFFGGSNLVYFGFTAATGGLSNTQQIRNITTTATLENQPPTNLRRRD